jgi:hypothetical protein
MRFVLRLRAVETACSRAEAQVKRGAVAGAYSTIRPAERLVVSAIASATAGNRDTILALRQLAQGKKTIGLRTLAVAEREARKFVDLWNAFVRKLNSERAAAGLPSL